MFQSARTHRWHAWHARTVLLTSVLTAFTLVAAACSSSSKPTSSSPSTSGGPPGATSNPGTVETVPVAMVALNPLHLGFVVMQQEPQIMQSYSIKPDFVQFQSIAQVVPALVSGSAHFGIMGPSAAWAATAKDPTVKIVAAELVTDPIGIVASKSLTSLADLKGKTFGANAIGISTDYVTAVNILKQAGLTVKTDYPVVTCGTDVTCYASLTHGNIDFFAPTYPILDIAKAAGYHVLGMASDYPLMRNLVFTTLTSDTNWYSSHTQTAENFLAGYLACVKWLYDPANKDKAISDIEAALKYKASDATDIYNAYVANAKYEAYSKDGVITTTALNNTLKFYQTAGLANLPAADALDKTYDNTLVNAANKLVK